MGKTSKRREASPYWQLTAYAVVAALINTFIYKFVEGFEWPTAWMFLSLVLDVSAAWFFYGLTGSVRRAVLAQFLLCLLLRMLNAGKIHFLNTPFLPSDVFLVEEVYRVSPLWIFCLLAFLILTPLVGALVILATGLNRPTSVRAFGMVPFALFLFFLIVFPQAYSDAFDKLLEDEIYGIPFLMEERQQALGVPLSFTIDVAKFLAVFQDEPSAEDVQKALGQIKDLRGSAVQAPAQALPPMLKRNIYVVLIESFWDPSWLIEFEDAVAPDFRALWKENGGLHLLSPMFGGGTANVEFELLCGIPSRSVTKGIIFQVALANEIPCLPQVLKDSGYKTYAFHGFEGGYFNRKAALPSLGFEQYDAVEDMMPNYEKGTFINDRELYHEAMARTFERSKGEPFLTYIVTFAGHWPYAWLPEYNREIRLKNTDTDQKMDLLERHLNINRMSSEVAFTLIQKIRKQDPDGLIVVFGDHLPALGLAGKDPNMNDWRYYETPLLILDRWEKTKSAMKTIPAYMITSEILRRAGIPEEKQGYISAVKPPNNLLIGPEQNNSTFVGPIDGSNLKNCTPQSKEPDCITAFKWLTNIRIIARDLVVGAQKVRTTF